MNRYHFLLLCWICFLPIACTTQEDREIQLTLNQAGDNAPQLMNVLSHYSENPKDSLKLQAAKFLIRAMYWHENITSPVWDEYYSKLDSINRLTSRRGYITPEQDSLYRQLTKEDSMITNMPDSRIINTDSLILHIEEAFKYYKPERMSFSDFCEYLLPYRIGKERVGAQWLPLYRQSAMQSICYNGADSIEDVYSHLHNVLRLLKKDHKAQVIYEDEIEAGYSPMLLDNMRRGTCTNYSELACFLFRSLGIPTAIDLIPAWANRSIAHSWNAFVSDIPLEDTVTTRDFSLAANLWDSIGHHIMNREERISKIYRITFSAQTTSLAYRHSDEDIHGFFQSPFLKDVTKEYLKVADVDVYVDNLTDHDSFIYLATFDNRNWVPVAWADLRHGKAVFQDVGQGVVYLPCRYIKGNVQAVASPFVLDYDGQKRILTPDTLHRESMRLYRKYGVSNKVKRYMSLLKGGRIEISNDIRGNNPTVVAQFQDSLPLRYQRIDINPAIKGRYILFRGGDGTHGGEIAEMDVFGMSGERLKGTPIGSHAKSQHEHSLAFDGDPLTYFMSEQENRGWIGLDLGRKETVSHIDIIQHNDDNFIRCGDLYEMFYWDKFWRSLGCRIGTESQYLEYDSVPVNALLLLRDRTWGKEERIFTYEDGKQVWW